MRWLTNVAPVLVGKTEQRPPIAVHKPCVGVVRHACHFSLSLSLSLSLFLSLSLSSSPFFHHLLRRACYCIICGPVRPIHEHLRHHHDGSRSLLPAVRTGSADKWSEGEEVWFVATLLVSMARCRPERQRASFFLVFSFLFS
ncbi:hypothetical protein LY76DRAFT_405312 [Colletotrichum caudatum]|nr:hypothetical protein LY76DRAFT_405312 [Colletotrichum caudatum]